MAGDNNKQCSLGLSAHVITPVSSNWQFFTTGNPKRNCCPLLPRDYPLNYPPLLLCGLSLVYEDLPSEGSLHSARMFLSYWEVPRSQLGRS